MAAERILVVDDEPDICSLVSEILSDEGYKVSIAENAKSACEQISNRQYDLVLLDIWMPDQDGITLLKEWKENQKVDCPIIMMSGHGTVETAVEATRLGAFGFIEKPLTTAKLISTARKALDAHPHKESSREDKGTDWLVPVGSSPVVEELIANCKRCAKQNASILLQGEEGSGRGNLAHYIHQLSERSNRPLLVVSYKRFNELDGSDIAWAAVKSELIENIRKNQAGAIYLENFNAINEPIQQRLVDLLQQLQDADVFQRFDVRLTVGITSEVSKKVLSLFQIGFGMLRIELPPLREHKEDIPDLINHFIDYFCSNENYPYRKCSIAAQNAFLHHHWPGNLTELKGVLQQLLIIGGEQEIELKEVQQLLQSQQEPGINAGGGLDSLFNLPLREAREAFEKHYLVRQLEKVDGSVTRLAEVVSMERTNLYRKLRALGINSKQ